MQSFFQSIGQVISPQGAFLLALIVALFFYVRFLRRASAKARAALNPETIEETKSTAMSETEIERYTRHLVLREIGGQGQAKMRAARVLVIGAGGLGSPILFYLAAAGVGTIGVIDDDIVSLSNLQRQVLFDEDQLDMPKVFAAQSKLAKLNPFIEVQPFHRRIDAKNATKIIEDFDMVIDGCDSFSTRQIVNAACVHAKTPLISGAISQWEGQISLYEPSTGTPCFKCIFPTKSAAGLAPSCAEGGVVGSLPGIVGSIMATEAIKFITGAGAPIRSEMLIFDALYGESRKIKLNKNPNCPTCGTTDEANT